MLFCRQSFKFYARKRARVAWRPASWFRGPVAKGVQRSYLVRERVTYGRAPVDRWSSVVSGFPFRTAPNVQYIRRSMVVRMVLLCAASFFLARILVLSALAVSVHGPKG